MPMAFNMTNNDIQKYYLSGCSQKTEMTNFVK